MFNTVKWRQGEPGQQLYVQSKQLIMIRIDFLICVYLAIGGSKIKILIDAFGIMTFNIVRTTEYKKYVSRATLGCIVYAPEKVCPS